MDMEQGDSLAGYKAQRIEQDRRRLVAMSDTDRRCAALELALKYEVNAHVATKAELASKQTPAVPLGWHDVDADLCGVEFTVHFKVGDDNEREDWRIYPAGTSVDIAHALNSGSELYRHLDDEVAAAIDRMDADEAEHVATAGVLSLREAAEVL